MTRRKRHFLILGTLGALLFAATLLLPSTVTFEVEKTTGKAPEIEKILALTNLTDQSEELKKLLERVGPLETQEEMLRSGLPFTGETHLLVHTIGDFIYDKFGKDGLVYCKDYFLSACYHAVILHTLADNGLPGVAEAMTLCEENGGSIVSSQCAHGAGHGFLAWHDYDLLKALEMCDALGVETPHFAYFNCYDGAFMENVWGVHNGAPSPKRWVKAEDPFYPCTDPRIAEKYLSGCWSNQATLLYQRFSGDLRKTAVACDAVINNSYRETCYNNFSRQIHPLTEGKVAKVKELCSFATGQEWQDYCLLTNMVSYWSVGDRTLPFAICSSTEGPLQEECFNKLVNLIPYYYPDERKKNFYCSQISSKIPRENCLDNNS